MEHETGESAQGEVYLERLLEVVRLAGPIQLIASAMTSITIPKMARIAELPDRSDIAEAAAEIVLSDQSIIPIYVLQAKAALALIAAQKGDSFTGAQRVDNPNDDHDDK